MLQQVQLAREALGIALGQIQDIPETSLNTESLARSLATSIRCLFAAESEGLKDNEKIGTALDHLRDVLQAMQNAPGDASEIDTAMATVARIMALLFPVCKALPDAEQCRTLKESVVPPPPSHGIFELVSDERRRDARIELETDIGLHSETNFFTGFSLDISTGGLFVASYHVKPVGTPVNLNFTLPSGVLMSINGHVRWIRVFNPVFPDVTPGMGIHFDGLTAEQQRQINAYIQTKTPLFYDD